MGIGDNMADKVVVNNTTKSIGLISLPTMAFISLILAILKLSAMPSLSWLVVFLPLICWAAFAILVSVFILGIIFVLAICGILYGICKYFVDK